MKSILSLFLMLNMVSISALAKAELTDELTSAIDTCHRNSDRAEKAGHGMTNTSFDKGLYGIQVMCVQEEAQNLMAVASKILVFSDESYSETDSATKRRVFDAKKRDFFCIYRLDGQNKRLPVCYLRLTLDSVEKK